MRARAAARSSNGRDDTRSGTESRFEEEALDFHEKVRSGYLELARLEPDRFRIIDAAKEESQVQADIREVLEQYLDR